MINSLHRPRNRASAWLTTACLALAGVALTGFVGLTPSLAQAGPRDDMKTAYAQALEQFNNLEYDAALGTINSAIAAAESAGAGQDPVLASLYLLRAALTYSNEGKAAKDRVVADLQRALTLNYYVVVPVELRSDDLTKFMQQARSAVGAAPEQPITLMTPAPACDAPLLIEALLGVPDGGQAALYWRKAGSTGEFAGAEMPTFSNVAEAVIPADQHANESIEYFIYAFDASSNAVANLGTQDAPLTLEQSCKKEEPVEEPVVTEPVDDDKKKKDRKPSSLPRVWINLGVGTGFGIASGAAENTYQQFFPRGAQAYGEAESTCAIARWVAGNRELADVPDAELLAAFEAYGPAGLNPMSYDESDCAQRHPVSTGMAIAPLHVAPEVSFRIGSKISLGLYSRLQVVTGAKVFRDDPTKDLSTSFVQDVTSSSPQGIKQQIKFSWTVGAKFKYFIGKDEWKLRPYVGAFAGYGNARLRVDMGFSNDRNGNSVPDAVEQARDNDLGGNCYPVWPYNQACDQDVSEGDNLLALQVVQNADKANRIDVVRIGPGFIGALVGFNYQIVKNFALFGELNVGVWFPNQTSLLFDITVGPAITF